MTPGKWLIEQGSDYIAIVSHRGDSVVWIAQVCEDETFTATRGVEFPSVEEAEANARIMAAAKELLAALERLVGDPNCTCGEDGDCPFEQARTAIKHAKGDI